MTEVIPVVLPDMGEYVRESAACGRLVVQPRMGVSAPDRMAAGLRAVAAAGPPVVATITLDSYTRIGDHANARQAVAEGRELNGFPLVAHGAALTARVTAGLEVPVQVRHGSAKPGDIFATMAEAGLSASEGGPVSYCLPYGRTPLAESVAAWQDAVAMLVERCAAVGARAHLETFGGAMLGQLCPPSLLVAISVLESLFFVRHGARSVSLSYAQQTHALQDVEALAALSVLADELIPAQVDRHVVLYAYMGVFPRTGPGARRLMDDAVEIAVRGGASRLIVKTVAEAHRIPTVAENVDALRAADDRADRVRSSGDLPSAREVDCERILAEARSLIEPVLEHGAIGSGLLDAFRSGRLDVPYCVHNDNRGLAKAAIDADGRLCWAETGRLPLPRTTATRRPIRAADLLRMLGFMADRYDRDGSNRPGASQRPYRIVVVGTGPRGLSVLERLAVRLRAAPVDTPVEVSAVDAVEPGAGRIWRTDQPRCLLMNTPAGEVTMFSGPPDGGSARPGAGPSLAEWWQTVYPGEGDASSYAPRAVYGKYLRFVLSTVHSGLPGDVRVRELTGRVARMDRPPSGSGWVLTLADGEVLQADQVVLATGHTLPGLNPEQRRLATAAARAGVPYVRGDSPADMPLADLSADMVVGVLGMGLAWYDVMSLLTEGRGGRFVPTADGVCLRYVPSGREPRIVAGSRSGVPLPARGRNQKTATDRYEARIFTRSRVDSLRANGRLDFRRQVLPLLLAELALVYYGTDVTNRLGRKIAELFVERAAGAATDAIDPVRAVAEQAVAFWCRALPPLDLARLADPFGEDHFPDRAAFRDAVLALIREDVAEAERGNVGGPLKAALDTARDVRATVRAAVDLSGLTAASHAADFLGSFVPVLSHLSTGPPLSRLRQVVALVEAGLLEFAGPKARFDIDTANDCLVVSSSHVTAAPVRLDAVVDARMPVPDIRTDTSELLGWLREHGIVTSYVNTDAVTPFDTGGLAVTASPYHPVDIDGRPVGDVYALGIPTEHTRWFTQVGSGRPGPWGEFVADADAVAGHVLAAARSAAKAGTEAPRETGDVHVGPRLA
jgi:methylaspartate mutase epsilon subunit